MKRKQRKSKSTKWALVQKQCSNIVVSKRSCILWNLRILYIYTVSQNSEQHIISHWLRCRRFASLLKPVLSICFLYTLSYSLSASLCSLFASLCFLSALLYFLSAFLCFFLASLYSFSASLCSLIACSCYSALVTLNDMQPLLNANQREADSSFTDYLLYYD